MRTSLAVVLAVVLALGGCGGDSSKAKPSAQPSAQPTATKSPATSKKATKKASASKPALDAALPQIPDGTPAPEALLDFACARDDKGRWRASGAVKNGTDTSVTYQVTVHVGPADGDGAAARTKRIAGVQAHGSARFDLGKIETRAPDGPCHVQVLALS